KVPFVGNLTPYSWLHQKFSWSMGEDKEAMKRDVKTVTGWDFERVIPCHGDVIEKDGKKAWTEAVVASWLPRALLPRDLLVASGSVSLRMDVHLELKTPVTMQWND
ncbi:hypothetical protein MPER_09587, partial [Moniliophthora perniciosa FA553]